MLPGRSAPVQMTKILLYLFPDLRVKRESKAYTSHIHMPGICIGQAYAYLSHLHMCPLYICYTSAYVPPIHMLYICIYLGYAHPGAMNIVSDMCHISIQTRERTP
ncbi:hypothetical protein XT66_22965 [Salmonella enterica subsp. salamae]|nr:hypothetical protein [Salmonella enterica subsp. salamae]